MCICNSQSQKSVLIYSSYITLITIYTKMLMIRWYSVFKCVFQWLAGYHAHEYSCSHYTSWPEWLSCGCGVCPLAATMLSISTFSHPVNNKLLETFSMTVIWMVGILFLSKILSMQINSQKLNILMLHTQLIVCIDDNVVGKVYSLNNTKSHSVKFVVRVCSVVDVTATVCIGRCWSTAEYSRRTRLRFGHSEL